MNLDLALIYNRTSGFQRHMSPNEFEKTFAGNEKLGITATNSEERGNLDIIDEERGIKLFFRRSHYRKGCDEKIEAHYVSPKGYALRGHVYDDPKAEREHLEDAVKKGKHILIRLNNDFDPCRVNWENMNEPEGRRFANWINEVGGDFHGTPVATVQELTHKLGKIKEYARQPAEENEQQSTPKDKTSKRIWFLHKDIIMPYEAVVIQNNTQLAKLFEDLSSKRIGVNPTNQRRNGNRIGFPRLFQFNANGSSEKPNVILGNHTPYDVGKPLMSQLTCPRQNGEVNAQAYRKLRRTISENRSFWVLGSPYTAVKTGNKGGNGLKLLRFHIANQTAQINVANDNTTSMRNPKRRASTPEAYRAVSQPAYDTPGKNL